jgi:Uma2 family endonuclease
MPLAQEIYHYSYADYLEWDESERCEIIDGEVVILAAPTSDHQWISGELFRQIANYLTGKPCKIYPAPFSVRLFPKKDNSDDTVFEPDIVVICDPDKIDKRGCNGAPDLIIEISSPSTARYDKVVKLRKYQDAGVREYWIVEPDTKIVTVSVLKGKQYIHTSYDETEEAPVSVLEGCKIDLPAVFAG